MSYVPTSPVSHHSSRWVKLIRRCEQGTADNFYKQGQLLPENFVKAAEGKGNVNLRFQDGYDHSYFTMATFADDHVNHAARYLLEGDKP